MASTDSLEDNRAFAERHDASFPILSDPDGAMSEAYGVLMDNGMARRWTFYIGPAGLIRHIDREVDPRTAGEDLVENLETLGAPRAGPARP